MKGIKIAKQAARLFEEAAQAWTRGNNSGNSKKYTEGERQCDQLRESAEKILKPFGFTIDYPGLYPSFSLNGYSYYSAEEAVRGWNRQQEEKK